METFDILPAVIKLELVKIVKKITNKHNGYTIIADGIHSRHARICKSMLRELSSIKGYAELYLNADKGITIHYT